MPGMVLGAERRAAPGETANVAGRGRARRTRARARSAASSAATCPRSTASRSAATSSRSEEALRYAAPRSRRAMTTERRRGELRGAARARAQQTSAKLKEAIGYVIVGQNEVVDQTLWGLLAGGHVLLEGAPGLGKTLLVRTLSSCLDLKFSRIQFTPDLMPSDVTGTNILVTGGRRRAAFHAPQGADLRAGHPRRRDQPRHAEDAERAARGDAGARVHHRRARGTRWRSRSSCSPPRTRSRWRARTRCPRRSSIASCSR